MSAFQRWFASQIRPVQQNEILVQLTWSSRILPGEKNAICRKKGGEKWRFTYRKLPFVKNCIFSLVPVPNCSRTNARNSLIYLYCFAVWVLLYLAFAVTYDCVANNTRNIYLVEASWREGIQGPFVSLLSKTCRDHPKPPSPASKGPKPCGF